MGFVNTIDLLGEDQTIDAILTGAIDRYVDDREYSIVASMLFRNCENLTAIIMPRAPVVMFYGLGKLTIVDTNAAKLTEWMLFTGDQKLSTLVLRNTSAVVPLNVSQSQFDQTSIHAGNGYIYVPRSLVESYKAETNWAAYGDQIRAIEDYSVDGRVDGPIDETKI